MRAAVPAASTARLKRVCSALVKSVQAPARTSTGQLSPVAQERAGRPWFQSWRNVVGKVHPKIAMWFPDYPFQTEKGHPPPPPPPAPSEQPVHEFIWQSDWTCSLVTTLMGPQGWLRGSWSILLLDQCDSQDANQDQMGTGNSVTRGVENGYSGVRPAGMAALKDTTDPCNQWPVLLLSKLLTV